MTAPLTFHQTYPGGRILLMMGQHEFGVIYPPAGHPDVALGPWNWRTFGDGLSRMTGRAKTELAAKNALLAEAREWLQKAGVE
jgi:hypothetical protein